MVPFTCFVWCRIIDEMDISMEAWNKGPSANQYSSNSRFITTFQGTEYYLPTYNTTWICN